MSPRPYGNYVLLERIGTGGMSEIDLARKGGEEASFVRFLVIKRIKADHTDDPSFVRMFKDEARISGELHHGNIAQTYDFGRHGDEYYLVLEYVPGLDLRRIVNTVRERGGTIPLKITLRIVCEVLEGLQYAHTRQDTFGRPMHIVHRDVNPRNIMVSTRGESKVIDFGVAKAVGRLERTRTDHVKGKFAYMAPEQVAGHEVDHRADIFAVALTLHEMIAGYGPFYGLNHVQIMHRLMSGSLPELPPHPDLPDFAVLRRVQSKALATRPEDRYQDCDSYRKDLERVAERIGGLATRQEVTDYLGTVEPGLEERLRAKMAAYAGPLDTDAPKQSEVSTLEINHDLSGSIRFDESPAPMSGSFTGTGITRTGAAVGVGAVFFVGLAVALLLLIVIGIAVASYEWGGTAGATGPAATVGAASKEAPDTRLVAPDPIEPAVVAPIEAPVVEEPAPVEVPAKEAPREVRKQPPAEVVVSKEPVPEPKVVVVEAAPEPAKEPVEVEAVKAPEPAAPVDMGTVQVMCTRPDLRILVDGSASGYRTGSKGISIPVAVGKHTMQVEGYAAQTVDLKSKQAVGRLSCL